MTMNFRNLLPKVLILVGVALILFFPASRVLDYSPPLIVIAPRAPLYARDDRFAICRFQSIKH